MEHCKNLCFSMIFIRRVCVESVAVDKAAIKRWSKHRTCIYEGFELNFSASSRSLGGVLEAAWRHLKASWRRHDEAEVRLMM